MALPTVMRAATTAARWHAAQKRKGAAAEPYVNHLLEVASMVAEAGADADTITAALLHDAIEDQKICRHVIAAEFNERVAVLVEECTDDKSLAKEQRKSLQIETAASKSPQAKIIKLADKTSNLRAVASSPPAHWPIERRRAYVVWSRDVANAGLLGQSPLLDRYFEAAAAQAEAVLA